MEKVIEVLVDGVLHELEIYGLTQSTIMQYRKGFYRPIIKYFIPLIQGIILLKHLNLVWKTMKFCIHQGKLKGIITNETLIRVYSGLRFIKERGFYKKSEHKNI